MQKSLLLILLLGVFPAVAQTSFHVGPLVGAIRSSVHYGDNPPYARPATTYYSGFEAGLLGSLQQGHLAFQPAVLFTQRGYRSSYEIVPSPGTLPPSSYANTTRLNYLVLPLNLAYIQRPNGQGFQVFAGPYLSCLVGGHFHTDYSFYTLGTTGELAGEVVAGDHNPSTAGKTDIYSKRWDVGLQAGLGYQYRALLLQVGYSIGLRNLAATIPGYPPGTIVTTTPIYNRGGQLSLIYFFDLKS
jgi:hypothetical protein